MLVLLACLELRIIQLKGVLGERVNFTVKLNVNISLVLDAIERERERKRERGYHFNIEETFANSLHLVRGRVQCAPRSELCQAILIPQS